MSTTGLIVTIVVIVAVLVIAYLAWRMMRRRNLQHRFGPEYDRTVAEQPNRAAAEHELRAREQRHAELDLRDLSPQDQQRYVAEWQQIQASFVDDPRSSMQAADELITDVMRARGYPTGDFEERVDTLSVEHARTLDHYRNAHEIAGANDRGEASTEQLRQALVHYRALAGDLLGPSAGAPGRHTANASTPEGDQR
jgi:FtsZ-interacting cell division protein ZipA